MIYEIDVITVFTGFEEMSQRSWIIKLDFVKEP